MKQEKTNIRRSVHALRRTLLLALLAGVAAVPSAHGQAGTPPGGRFEWVKSYSAWDSPGDYYNHIVGTATDSQGNLYVAGNCAYGASIDGQSLLPASPYGLTNKMNGVVMKFSPEGHMLWKRSLHGNAHSTIYGMQLVGDSALYLNGMAQPPTYPMYNGNPLYLYLYDTLITHANCGDWLYYDSLYTRSRTSVITVLDLDGRIKENYILYMAYKDNEGRLITADRYAKNNPFDSVRVANNPFGRSWFYVDPQGYVYCAQKSADVQTLYCDTCEYEMQQYGRDNGLISETIVMVNGRRRFSVAPHTIASNSNVRIMKFSPHFEDLVLCKYVYKDDGKTWSHISPNSLGGDGANGITWLHNMEAGKRGRGLQRLALAGDTTLAATFPETTNGMIGGMLVRFDEDLNPTELLQLDRCDTGLNQYQGYMTNFLVKCEATPDSNSLVLFGKIGVSTRGIDIPLHLGQDTMNLGSTNAYMVRCDEATNRVQASASVGAPSTTVALGLTSVCTLDERFMPIVANNRIMFNVSYEGGICHGDSMDTVPVGRKGTGVYVCDYNGNYIDYIGISRDLALHPVSSVLSLHDSNLYIGLSLEGDLPLEGLDTVLYPEGASQAAIMKYVDGSFATPYVHPTPQDTTGRVGIESAGHADGVAVYPNPATSRVHIALPGGGTASECLVISANGLRHRERVEAGTVDLGRYPSGVYYLEIITDNNIYKSKIVKL